MGGRGGVIFTQEYQISLLDEKPTSPLASSIYSVVEVDADSPWTKNIVPLSAIQSGFYVQQYSFSIAVNASPRKCPRER